MKLLRNRRTRPLLVIASVAALSACGTVGTAIQKGRQYSEEAVRNLKNYEDAKAEAKFRLLCEVSLGSAKRVLTPAQRELLLKYCLELQREPAPPKEAPADGAVPGR